MASEDTQAAQSPTQKNVAKSAPTRTGGLQMTRRFTKAGEPAFETVEWELRTATIMDDKGEILFEQKDVEIPKAWSQLATNVVVSKYFRGAVGKPGREHSVKQLIGRVADTITKWGEAGGYFASPEDRDIFREELTHLLVHQKMAFNSPSGSTWAWRRSRSAPPASSTRSRTR